MTSSELRQLGIQHANGYPNPQNMNPEELEAISTDYQAGFIKAVALLRERAQLHRSYKGDGSDTLIIGIDKLFEPFSELT